VSTFQSILICLTVLAGAVCVVVGFVSGYVVGRDRSEHPGERPRPVAPVVKHQRKAEQHERSADESVVDAASDDVDLPPRRVSLKS
jgi:hypothetical protein